jgi:hypothetical protein
MRTGWKCIAFAVPIALAPIAGNAQFRWPDPPSQAPSQQPQQPAPAPAPAPAPSTEPKPPTPKAKPKPRPQTDTGRTMICGGAFARTASHADLVKAFGEKNVVFTSVDGPGGSKLDATVIFPQDSRRRLEVLWRDEARRQGPRAIVITGASTWGAPRGVRLGLTLPALEKLNGKPFKMTGFDAQFAQVVDWQGGALANLPGGCQVGMRLTLDQKAPQGVRTKVSGAGEFQSSDAAIRAVRPRVVEIVIGYSN